LETKTTKTTVKQDTNLLLPTPKVKRVLTNPEQVPVLKEVVSLVVKKALQEAVASLVVKQC